MEKNKQRLRRLLQASTWDEQDKEWIRHYLAEHGEKDLEAVAFECYQQDLDDSTPALDSAESEQLLRKLHERLDLPSNAEQQPATWNHRPFLRIAAAVLLLSLMSWWFWGRQVSAPVKDGTNLVQQVITPGGNKATLVLSDGQSVDLSETKDGIVMGLGGQVAYRDGSLVSLDQQPSTKDQTVINHYTLSVPKGGQYQLTLSDGTRVWLNSASILRYPSRFSGNFREVELEGEAFFEVSHRGHHQPFIVKTPHQSTTVLGTTFNIMAYADETEVTTTLVSGAVRVDYTGKAAHQAVSAILAPGEASVLLDGVLRKQKVDVAVATAWKEGKFYFKKTPFAQMMRQLARWYDVDVVYQGSVPNETFSGELSKDMPLETVLDFLIGSDIHFTTQKRTLVFN